MSATEDDEVEWVETPPEVELYLDKNERGEEMLVAHEFVNPFGWIASSCTMEVRR